ncbi:hypothetical protein T10_11669 [Trichinella papuae]|uniref:Uncharacterized protein n=1 Tax=Trichinella papuae TaxID=268474 RepID=A0A0V1N1J8_9BILA|nr:hypothetical protein T10_11669 [Trichinella papuae]
MKNFPQAYVKFPLWCQGAGNTTVGDLRRLNKVYAEKQQRVAQYTGEYTNGRCTLEQFLEAFNVHDADLMPPSKWWFFFPFSLFPLC